MSLASEQIPSQKSSNDAPPERIADAAAAEYSANPIGPVPMTEGGNAVQIEACVVSASHSPDVPSSDVNKPPSVDQISTAPESGQGSIPVAPASPPPPSDEISTNIRNSADHPLPEQPDVETLKTAPRPLKNPLIDGIINWLIALVAGIWLLFTILYAWDVSSVNGIKTLFPSVQNPAQATLDLRILSEGVTLILNILLAYSTGVAMWAAASTKRGITFSTWLAMSPATDYWGLFHLLRWKRNKAGRDLHLQWIFVR